MAVAGATHFTIKAFKNPLGTIGLIALTGFAAYLINQTGMKAIGWTKEKLIENFLDPSKHEEEFIEIMYEHPVIFDKLHKAILFASQKLKNKEALEVLDKFIDYHHLGEDKEYEQIMQSTRYSEYQKYYLEQAKIIEQEGNYKNICAIKKPKILTESIRLPDYLTKRNDLLFSVGSYRSMIEKNNTNIQNDHIPSYRALAEHFNVRKNSTLKYNGISIKIPTNVHVGNAGSRTHSFRNKKIYNGKTKYQLDSSNLLLATIKDLSFTTLYLSIKNLDNITYMQSTPHILEKNYELCLYY